MKLLAAGCLLLAVAYAFGQKDKGDGPEFKKQPKKEVKTTTAPVNHAEAAKTLQRAWDAMAKGLKLKGSNPVKLPNDAKPITKDEVLSAYRAMVLVAQPSFKRAPTPVAYNAKRFRKDFNQGTYLKLVKDGFVMPYGPLVVGSSGTVSTYEFGDSLGVFMLRVSDLAHMPSRKFSPNLMKPGIN